MLAHGELDLFGQGRQACLCGTDSRDRGGLDGGLRRRGDTQPDKDLPFMVTSSAATAYRPPSVGWPWMRLSLLARAPVRPATPAARDWPSYRCPRSAIGDHEQPVPWTKDHRGPLACGPASTC